MSTSTAWLLTWKRSHVRFDDVVGRNVVIWGTGREGRAAHAELGRRGIPSSFVLTGDGVAPEDLAAITATGADAMERLRNADVVITSPGVPHTSPEFRRLRELDIPVTSLTDLWLADSRHRVVAVTGTKGKSTTSALVHHLLEAIGIPAALVGNGGTPVTDGDTSDAEVAVTEVSSYQAAALSSSPRVAVVTSLYPEHLPWHGSYEQYVADKLNLVAHGCELVVLPDTSGEIAALVRGRANGSARLTDPAELGISWSETGVLWDTVGALAAEEIPLRGKHNLANVALALTAVAAGFDIGPHRRPELLAAVRSFPPLTHRLEVVPSDDGRTWVDDSLATAPEAVVAALRAYPRANVTLILGGADRGLSFDPIRTYLHDRPAGVVEVIAVGPAGARFMGEGGAPPSGSRLAATFAEALAWIRDDPGATDVVLLSPGAPSFDEFASYEERSAAFRAAAGSTHS